MFIDGPHAAQNIFMTPASGIDNAAMSSSQPDSLPLAGLPSYDDVVAHSDIYASSIYCRRICNYCQPNVFVDYKITLSACH